jgi:tripartite-type tricarboxylate transporter receptor subunit TctC
MKTTVRLLGAALLLTAVLAGGAAAQDDAKAKLQALKPKDFPTQPIEFVVVYPAGGGMDVTARVLAKYVEKLTDQRVVVANRTGGAGLIGHTYLATQAKNDGYTVGILANPFWVEDEILRAKGKWTYKDLTPVGFINYDPVTWIVTTDGPFKDKPVQEIVAQAKAKPGTVKIAIAPDGAFQFLAEGVEAVTGAKFVKVPFQGGAPGVTALVGGHVDVATGFLAEYRGHLDAGKVRVVAVAGAERSIFFPQVPTFNESLGAKDLVWLAWRFAAVPKGVPADRLRYLEAAIDAAMHDRELIDEYKKLGVIAGTRYLKAKETTDEIERFYLGHKEFLTKSGRAGR